MSGSRRLRSRFQRDEESTGLVLWRVTNAWQAAQRAALKDFGLTHVQFVLLASLTWLDREEPVTQRELAEHARTDPMMTSQVLRALEAAGLVKRASHPDDARAKLLSVTPAGVELANAAIVAVEACDAEFFEPLGPHRATFTRQLARLSGA